MKPVVDVLSNRMLNLNIDVERYSKLTPKCRAICYLQAVVNDVKDQVISLHCEVYTKLW